MGGSRSLPSRPAVVNAGLPLMNPWGLPGMSLQEGRREKYYFTDRHDLCFTDTYADNLEAPDGFRKTRGWGWMFMGDHETSVPNFMGSKTTFEFHARGDSSGVGVASKTSWIMNVYSLIAGLGFLEDELVLCHVFEDDSPAYDARPTCLKFYYDMSCDCDGLRNLLHCRNRASNAPSNSSDPLLDYYMADLENVLLGDPHASTVILSDYYDLPFSDILDWRKFAVVLKETDVYQLKSILKSKSQEEFIALHKSLVQVQKHFEWHSRPVSYDSFHMVMYETWLRHHVIKY